MILESAIAEAEDRVRQLRAEVAHDERAIAAELARARRADENVEQWWFGRARWRRLGVAMRVALLNR